MRHEPTELPGDLPVPMDDGAALHLPGTPLPALALAATDGSRVRLDTLGDGVSVIYAYPRTGRPGEDPPPGWDSIPGARGCTPEACGFRDQHRALLDAGAGRVYGLSTQPTDYQAEAVSRLGLPFPLLSDESLALVEALRLPTFEAAGMTLYRRLTLVVRGGLVEHVFYPVFPPGTHAEEVLRWLRDHSTP